MGVEFLAALLFAGFLLVVAVTPKETMNLIWIAMVLAILLSPILIFVHPIFR